MTTGQTRPRSLRRRMFGAALAFSISFLAVCLVGEVVLRATGEREQAIAEGLAGLPPAWTTLLEAEVFESLPHPVRRYAMRPGARVTVHDEVTEEDWLFRVNSHRTRGPEFPLEKPVNERRIVCLGDSFAFGLWCDEGETLVEQLARRANEAETEPDVRWRGINLGVPGYHTGQQYLSLVDEGFALDPDVVVLYYNTNDIGEEGFFYDDELDVIRVDLAPLPTWLKRVLWNSHLYGFLTRKLLTDPAKRLRSPHLDPRVRYAFVREDNQRYCRAQLERIATACEESGVPLFFVNQPLMTWSDDARAPTWRLEPLYHWAREIVEELGVPQVGLLGWLRGYSDGVDRVATLEPGEAPPPPDFRPDFYFADPAVQRWVKAYREGRPLPAEELPPDPDFHLLGEGYASISNVVYAAMREEDLVP